ncbi:MAG: EAL domain-containing protein [Enterobacterales bacterium]|nr:EAL domain-containing protein [Enterobacterales bacterium]
MNLLIVDDDIVDRAHIKRTLRRFDTQYQIVEAENVNSALSLLNTMEFDAILLDYNMPQRNGIELLLELRKENNDKASAIIMMSTSEEEELAMECLKAGAQDFIAKSDITGFRLKRAIMGAKARFEMEVKLQNSYEKVKQLAEHDSLTQLANRYLFDESIKRAIANNHRKTYKIALLLFDLDHFKDVNDNYGHDIGDLLLKKVVRRVRSCMRGPELFARLGGDEFAITLNHLKKSEEADKVALRILKVLEKPFYINQTEIMMGASIGISIYPDNAKNATEMFKYADIAMYRAKTLGRNQLCFFEEEMQKQFVARFDTENKLRSALKNFEFKLHYQPVFNAKTLHICGFEALIRWTSNGKNYSPDQFIPIAEDSHQINDIGRWVIEEAITQLAKWNVTNDKLTMSINLSPVQLFDPLLIPHIKLCLNRLSVPARSIEFELTETALLTNSPKTTDMIEQISQLGCKIALDDFGTGFSSISHLHSYPISTVKIDKSLMPTMEQPDSKLVTGLVSMFQSLELTVVAEGIESSTQLDFCKNLEIQKLQGYHLSKPLSADQINCHRMVV